MRPNDYLDRVRKLTATGSDYAVAKLLGISEDAVNHYRKGTRHMDNYAALRIAEALALPLEELIASIELEREKAPEKRDRWRAHLKALGQRAAIVLLGAIMAAIPQLGDDSFLRVISSSDCGTIRGNNNYPTWWRRIWGMRRPAPAL